VGPFLRYFPAPPLKLPARRQAGLGKQKAAKTWQVFERACVKAKIPLNTTFVHVLLGARGLIGNGI